MANSVSDYAAIGTLASIVIGGIVAFFRLRPESEKNASSVASDAVVVTEKVINSLYKELERIQEQHEECEATRTADRKAFQEELARVRSENAADRRYFENQVAELKEIVSKIDERQAARRQGDSPPEPMS